MVVLFEFKDGSMTIHTQSISAEAPNGQLNGRWTIHRPIVQLNFLSFIKGDKEGKFVANKIYRHENDYHTTH
ncbi:hypothetical protein GCM10009117_09160 [Gangjinia marincola]|uniref:Uncharacterized protein n=1 Tax=Gangjinia marincola TaxID=578463 RepID=A0ABP3XTT8_9FLAO